MDRARFSFIAHRNHAFCNPVAATRMDEAVDQMSLRPGQRLVDIGAGKGELLIRAAERLGVRGVGVELAEAFAEEARRRAAERGQARLVTIEHADATDYIARCADESFDGACCVGSSHALGSYEVTLREIARLTRPGGRLLVGEGYWRKRPDPDYLEALGGAEDESRPHADNVAIGEAMGLTPLWARTAGEEEWDAYEWLYSAAVEDFAREHPDDPDADAMLDRIRRWRRAYLRWGRDTLGFGVYVFRKG